MATQYEVTALKYRPKTFDEMAGQEFVVSTIKNSLKNGHIANAYLFSGPRGCGKTSAARILARSLNCEKGLEAGPCGVCDNCISISQGASMDVIEIDGATHGKVDEARQIKDEVLFPPQSGRYKVYIIDEVHMLSKEAFNALLKTIEEPPPYICFIFATTEVHKVPATIKSRCQQFNFRLIPIETIQELLKKVCRDNNIQAEDDALFWIARESTGSMREAFTLFDQVVSFSAGNITSDLIREKLGIVGLEKLNALAETCASNDTHGAFALIDEILGSGVAIDQFIIDLAGYYRSLLLLKNGITKESLLGYRFSLFSVKVLEAYDSARLEQALEILLDCYRNIQYSVSPRFELETTISRLTWLNKWISHPELKNAIDNVFNILGGKPGLNSSQENQKKSDNVSDNTEKPQPVPTAGSGLSLSDEFHRMVAAKEAAASDIAKPAKAGSPDIAGSSATADKSADESSSTDEDDDQPIWRNTANKKNTESEQVEQVLSVIPGTIIKPASEK